MSLGINHNMMAANTARNLNNHYAGLSGSVRRLSSGLRIERAADDAAGLAIRELMRADIAALNQGVRNANDAISMIQTADGALGIIDEKLIRMKELAEQAATGTYNSDQRLMIDSEFQAMAAEIDRIAKATDFNNIKLLCNDPSHKLVLSRDIALTSYLGRNNELVNNGMPILPETIVINSEAITASLENLQFNRMTQVVAYSGDKNIENWYGYNSNIPIEMELHYDSGTNSWSLLNGTGVGEPFEHHTISGSSGGVSVRIFSDSSKTVQTSYNLFTSPSYGEVQNSERYLTQDTDVRVSWYGGNIWKLTGGSEEYPSAKVLSWKQGIPDLFGTAVTTVDIDLDGDGSVDIIQQFTQYADGNGTNGNRVDLMRLNFSTTNHCVTKIHFGPGNDAAEDYYYIETRDCTAKGLGIDQTTIETQDRAQNALETLNAAIIKKDQARAYFGAIQNRLENTISNLKIQAENLQSSESRISDADVASEMTEFVRNQILTQTAVAMLSQANSLPQMALQLIQSGG